MTPSIVIAGGGTAGHVYPGLALAEALRSSDARVCFVGTDRGIETTAVPAAGFPLHLIEVTPWSSSLGAKRFLAPFSVAGAVRASSRILRTERAGVVVGMGGYASMPVVLAARTARLPVILHEQNAIPGIANVVGARVTRNIALAFEEARARFPARANVRVVGNPIRDAVAHLDRAAARDDARIALGLSPAARVVIVFGGSLGAARLNAAAIALAERWKGRDDVEALLVTGPKHLEDVQRALPDDGSVRVRGYLDRMEHAYAAADLVVCRAGASTVAEVAASGTPAVLVPYPYARSDHQTANARSLQRAGGAIVVPDPEATADRLGSLVDEVLGDDARLTALSAKAKLYGKPDAARDLAAWVLELASAGAQ